MKTHFMKYTYTYSTEKTIFIKWTWPIDNNLLQLVRILRYDWFDQSKKIISNDLFDTFACR